MTMNIYIFRPGEDEVCWFLKEKYVACGLSFEKSLFYFAY